MDDNYKKINELDNRERIKLKYYNFKEHINDTHYIHLKEHNEKLALSKEIYFDLKMFMIQIFPDAAKLLYDKNTVDKIGFTKSEKKQNKK